MLSAITKNVRILGFALAAMIASIAWSAQPVQAQICSGAPTEFPTTCQPNCGSGYALAGNFISIDPRFGSAFCSSNQCCLQLGNTTCNVEAVRNGNGAGTCRTACASGETASQHPVSTCYPGLRCCYINTAPTAAAAGGCSTLAGVSSSCKTAATSDEINLGSETNMTSFFQPAACPGQFCVVKRGSELCTAFATQLKLGSYQCVSQDNCETLLSQTLALPGDACLAGQFCCKPKVTTVSTGGSAGTVSLPDPLSGANLPQLIGNVIRTFSGIAGAVALLMFVYGGIMWILSGGEQAKVSAAQKILMNATIGLILIFSAYFFTSAIVQGILANPQG